MDSRYVSPHGRGGEAINRDKQHGQRPEPGEECRAGELAGDVHVRVKDGSERAAGTVEPDEVVTVV